MVAKEVPYLAKWMLFKCVVNLLLTTHVDVEFIQSSQANPETFSDLNVCVQPATFHSQHRCMHVTLLNEYSERFVYT